MRKVFLIITSISLIIIYIFYKSSNKDSNEINKNISLSPTPSQAIINKNYLTYNNQTYSYSWFEVPDLDKLFLYPNFSQKKSSKEIIKNNNCQFLVNANFYDANKNPIGVFISEDKEYGKYQKNQLFNGFFYLKNKNDFGISDNLIIDHSRIVLQSGPLLITDNAPWELKIIDDEFARRIVLANNENYLFFMVFYKEEDNYSGPKLADLPKILELFSEKTGVKIVNALNLDGGSASVFFTKNIYLQELQNVGGFFCGK